MTWLRNPLKKSADASASSQPVKVDGKFEIMNDLMVPIMAIDRDFKIIYANKASMDLLRAAKDAVRSLWPNYDPEKTLGTCIDVFHKDPSHQRKFLADPSRLPYTTEITVAGLKLQLNVSALFDARGNYCGNALVWHNYTSVRHNIGVVDALDRSQAVIEFTLDGTIVGPNENFLKVLGYSSAEVVGKHHRIFVDPSERESAAYREFWTKLAEGHSETGQFKCIAKDGKAVWLQGVYHSVRDGVGKPYKVILLSTDVTSQVAATQALQLAVQETQGVVDAAKSRDLTQRIPLSGKSGEIEALCAGVNGILETMTSLLSEIKKGAHEVANASAEISASTTDLSQRTEEQAASLEETSASMEEISGTVKKNAENAQRASELTSNSHQIADRGGVVVADAVKAMARIEESSRKISDIIGVIDEIARQTNLLALNAAVEAARAGDAGRGFAVVASEVRSLAQRSSQAAKDIKDLISNSSNQVKDGVSLVNQAGGSLNEIVDSIKQVVAIVADIATASAEQSEGLTQINRALSQMDEATQQNSALVEENAASAKALEQQSTTMEQSVAAFKIADDGQAALAPVVDPAAARVTAAPRRPAALPKAPAKVEAKIQDKTQDKTADKTAAKTAVKAPAKAPAPAAKAKTETTGGPVGRMQAMVATAFKQEPDWKEF